MSESAAPETSKPRKKSKARKKAGRPKKGSSSRKQATRKKAATKKATTKKKAAKKATTKKKAAKKATTKKKAASAGGARGGRRAPQGRRLGGWEIVKREAVFNHLEKTGTTIATLARTLGVGSSAVHAWKAGRRYPSEQAQLKLRQILKGDLAPVAAPKGKKSPGKTRAFSGKAFRKLREERGLSRAKLSKQLGVSAGSIRNWEAGASKPRGGNLAKVQEFLAVSPAPSAPPVAAAAEAAASSGGDAAVLGAAQVASAYLAAGHPMTPGDVVNFLASLRGSLS